MGVEEFDGGFAVTGNDIPVFALMSLRLQLKLETSGMKHSSGVSRMVGLANWGIIEPKNRYTKNDRLVALAKLDRILDRIKKNRSMGAQENLQEVVANVEAEMTIEKALQEQKNTTKQKNSTNTTKKENNGE